MSFIVGYGLAFLFARWAHLNHTRTLRDQGKEEDNPVVYWFKLIFVSVVFGAFIRVAFLYALHLPWIAIRDWLMAH